MNTNELTIKIRQQGLHLLLALGLLTYFLVVGIAEKRSLGTTIFEAFIFAPLILGAYVFRHDYQVLLRSKIFLALLAYFAYSFLSVSWANEEYFNGTGYMIRSHLYSLFFFIGCVFIFSRYTLEQLKPVMLGLVPVGSLIASYSIFSFYVLQGNSIDTRLDPVGRLNIQHPTAFFYCVFHFLVIVYWKQIPPTQRWAYLFCLIPLVACIFLIGSRQVMLANILVLAFYFFGKRSMAAVLIAGMLLLFAIVLLILFPEVIQSFIDRGTALRPDIWLETLRLVSDNWLAGYGNDGMNQTLERTLPGGKVMLYHPHNLFLAVLFMGGIIGFILFMVLLSLAVRQLWFASSSPLKNLATLLLSCNLIILSFGGNLVFYGPGIRYFGLLLPLALCAVLELQKNNQTSGLE